jgi:hypothetical protein
MTREKPARKSAGRTDHVLHGNLTPREARLLAASPQGRRRPRAPKKK